MFIQTLDFNKPIHSLGKLPHFKYILLTLVVFISLFTGLWFLPQAAAQSESIMSFGYGDGLQFVDPDGQNSVPFWVEESYEGINFSLFPLSDSDFLTQYAVYEPSNDPWSGFTQILDTTEITPTVTWSTTVSVGDSYYWEGRPITMPAEISAGIYIMQADALDGAAANSIIVISRNVLVLKRGNNGQVVVWVSTLQDRTPVADMEITLHDISTGEAIDQGISDANGVVKLNAGDVEDVMVIGHKVADDGTSDTTLASLERDWRVGDGYWWWWRPTEPEDYRLYLYTDRPIYRPGHTVKFDAIARNNNLDGFTPIAASTAMTATLRDVRDNLVDTLELEADEYGTANGEFTLGDEISLGDYYVEIKVGEQTQRQRFMVEEYTKPEYSVEVSTPKSYAIEGEGMFVTVDSAYFFGQPVTDAKVTLKIYRQHLYNYYWWRYDDYSPYWQGNELLDMQEGTTDSEGRWTTTLEPSTNGNKYGATYTLVAEVTDAQEKAIQGQQSFKVFYNEFDLKLRTERYGYLINQPITVTLQTRNHDDTPHANQTVDVSVMSHRDEEPAAVQTLQAVTDADGNATLTFEGVPHGWYYLTATATDSLNRITTQTRYLCIYDPDASSWWWWGNRGDDISILPDKDSYAPGETAHLLIQSRVESGVGLLTLEREGVYDEILVNIDGPVTMVDVPITEEHGPNIFAKFHLFQKASESTSIRNREGNLITAKTEISVELLGKKLELSVSADKEKYRPGQSAQLTFTLQDSDGQPTAGRVSVALVDEAIFALQEDLSADLFDTFYARGENRVGTYHSLVRDPYWYGGDIALSAPTADAMPISIADEATFGDDGSNQEDQDSAPRRNFQDTAYWNANIDVGEDGTATITVPLPDNLTTWRITARAITNDTRVGTATGQLLVTKEIISRPTLPRFAVVGDRFSLRTVGQNYTGTDLQAEFRLESNHLVILDPDPQTLDIPNTKSGVGQWTAVASHMGTGLVTSTLYTDQGQDIVELPLRTKAFSAPERWIAAGQANPEATETFTMSLNAIHDASELKLYLSPSIALGLLDGLDDLIAYPYGCVEQTMSRVLPSAVAVQVYNKLELENPKADEIPKIVSKGLQKLYGYQYDNGGWGWFYDDERGLYLTSYVLLGLTMVQDAGFEVDSTVLDRGFDALDNMLDSNVTASTLSAEQRQEAENDDMRAFALYVKALAERGDLDAAQSLAQSASTLRTDSLAMLALALHLGGDTSQAQTLTDSLLARVNEDSNDAYWSTGDEGQDWYYWRTMASRDKYTAIAVRALATLRPDSPQLPKAVRWLMKNRRGAGWRNTQATAFAVLGLLDYIQVSGELESDYDYTISINDVKVANGQVTPATVTDPIEPIIIPGSSLQIGENQLTIARSDQGGVVAASVDATNPLYYTAQMRQELYFEDFTEIASAQEGLNLSRSYRLVEGEYRGDGAYNIGDVVEVTLELEIDDEVWYLLVEDPIPAGFEVLNERLNQTTFNTGSPYRYWWSSWGYNRKDIRDDRVDFFITRGYPGTRSFTYLMRATIPGTFSVLPGQAYPMYDDDMWARTASTQVTIAPEVLEPRPALLGDFDNDCRITEFDALQATAEWGSADGESDLIADGVVHLNDMAAAIQREGASCITAAGAVSLRPPTKDARFLLFVPDEEMTVGQDTRAYIMVEDVDDLGGFEFTLDYNQQVLQVKNVLLGDGVSKDVRQLGPTINNQAGQVTFGALDMAAAYGIQESRSQVQQVIASARASTNMANLRILSTVVFQAIGTGSTLIQVGDAQAMDSDGLMLAAAVDGNHQPTVGVDVGYLYLPLVIQ